MWAAGLDWRTVEPPIGEAYPDFPFPHDPANPVQGAFNAIDFACFAYYLDHTGPYAFALTSDPGEQFPARRSAWCLRSTFLGLIEGQRFTANATCNGAFIGFPYDLPSCSPPVDPNLGRCPALGAGGSGGGNLFAGNPIHVATGNKFQQATDFRAEGSFPLTFTRSYNSAASNALTGTLGHNWRHNYDRAIVPSTINGVVVHYWGDGKSHQWQNTGSGYTSASDRGASLVLTATGWTYRGEDDRSETYDLRGRLQTLRNRAGLTQALGYDAMGA